LGGQQPRPPRARTPAARSLHETAGGPLINLYHLKDDARGLARAKGLSKVVVEEFCRKSAAVDLCVKAGDTYKHGVGGRAGNNAVIEYEVVFHDRQGPEPQPTDPVVNAVMLVVDKGGEPHQSDLVAPQGAPLGGA
jgi:hypothetical protein